VIGTQPAPAYRVPRRYITVPPEPPPYGLVALSFLGHLAVMGAAVATSIFLGAHLDQSKVYIVNLVPAAPSPAPVARGPARPEAPARPAAPERPAPRPAAEAPREAPRPRPEPPPQRPPPPAPRAEAPPPRAEAPPLPVTPPPRVAEPPPRPADLAPRAPAVVPRPPDLALPRRAERDVPALDVPGARDRLVEPRALPPPPAVTPRLPDPPRPATAAPSAPPAAPTLPPATIASARPSPEPARPAGRPDGAPGTTPRSISLDVQDFPYTYYLRLIHAKIDERWNRPRGPISRSERTVVLFEILPDGSVRNVQVEQPSGNEGLDSSALRAVQDASPFPPLPQEFKGSHLRVHFGFDSELRDQG
jgi:TonB family protein